MLGLPNVRSRKLRSIQYLCSNVIEQLAVLISTLQPTISRDVFIESIYHPIRLNDLEGDDLLLAYKSENDGKLSTEHLIVIACAYCIQAMRTLEEKPISRTYLMDAVFYLGMAQSAAYANRNFDKRRRSALTEAISCCARDVSEVNTKPWRDAKEEAQRLACEFIKEERKFDSLSSVALEISQKIKNFLLSASPPKHFASDQSRNSGIEDWLKEMSDVQELLRSH